MTTSDFQVNRVFHVVDGDTLDASLTSVVGELDGWTLSATGSVRIRLVHLDTPERGEPGYHEAAADLTGWLRVTELGQGLRVAVSGTDPFGRYIGDVYRYGDRASTASDYMLREANNGTGWPVWLPPSLRPKRPSTTA